MPRSVFSLLWDRISSGSEIFGCVVSMSADGSHYWVLAHVTPTRDATGRIVGYHSNRRTASRAALDRIEPLHDALLAEERRQPSTPAAIEAGNHLLTRTLEDTGMGYDDSVCSLDAQEVAV